MDSVTIARSMRGSIGMLAMAWLMADTTNEKATAAGMPAGGGAYAIGRLGVLGDCPVDNVVAGAYFWNPDTMRENVAAATFGSNVHAASSPGRCPRPRKRSRGSTVHASSRS